MRKNFKGEAKCSWVLFAVRISVVSKLAPMMGEGRRPTYLPSKVIDNGGEGSRLPNARPNE